MLVYQRVHFQQPFGVYFWWFFVASHDPIFWVKSPRLWGPGQCREPARASSESPWGKCGENVGYTPRNPRIKSESWWSSEIYILRFLGKQDQLFGNHEPNNRQALSSLYRNWGSRSLDHYRNAVAGQTADFGDKKKQMSSCVKEMHRCAKRLFPWVTLTSDADFLLLPVWLWSFDMVFPVWLPLLLQNRFIAWHQAKIRIL